MRYKLSLMALLLILLVVVPPFFEVGLQYALINALIASLFAMSFNLLIGQGGMLSFGHAAYFGVGAFAVMHLMQSIVGGSIYVPTILVPFAGGAAGLVIGVFAGYFATMRSGVYFALVTLALSVLLYVIAPHWKAMFGGVAGLFSMRMPWLGFTFGPPIQVYYLVLGWTVVCIGLLYAYTVTPFGRLTLALRDNEQRVRFMGYNAHASKVVVFAISAMFSGVAGGLLAMANETINYSVFALDVSAQVVLQTFVGGSAVFFGPILGASLLTLFTFFVSGFTHSWLLYEGLLFVLVMLFMPNGFGGLIEAHVRRGKSLPWKRLAKPYCACAVGLVLTTLATVFAIESLGIVLSQQYQAALERSGTYIDYTLFGLEWSPVVVFTWLLPLVSIVLGIWLLRVSVPRIRTLWSESAVTDDTVHEGTSVDNRSVRDDEELLHDE